MKIFNFILCLFFAAALASGNGCGSSFGTPGDFAYYVFAQSWSAEFCSSHGDSGPLCANPTPFMQKNLTIHGLWPNFAAPQSGHDWPQCCTSKYGQDVDPNVIHSLASDIHKYWPDERNPLPGSNIPHSLWEHEWSKHGTCSGLDQTGYFKLAMQTHVRLGTPELISQNVGNSIDYDQLEEQYTSEKCEHGQPCWVAFQCDHGNRLAGITTCWKPDGSSLTQIQCPWQSVHSQSACSPENDIYLSSFGG